jgi:hypothetical protein
VGTLDKSRNGGSRSQTPGDWRRYYVAVLEDADRYLTPFVGHSSGRGPRNVEFSNSTTVSMRGSTPKVDRSANGFVEKTKTGGEKRRAANKMK